MLCRDNKFTASSKFFGPKELMKGHYTPNKKWTNEVWGLATYYEGDNFVTSSDDGTLRVWSASQRKQVSIIKTTLGFY